MTVSSMATVRVSSRWRGGLRSESGSSTLSHSLGLQGADVELAVVPERGREVLPLRGEHPGAVREL